ncbi:MAG: BrnT family toxin [Pseudomonadota bacterium]
MTPDFGFDDDETGERFVWDADKDTKNREKHGISFVEALAVFQDPKGLEFENLRHSSPKEKRFLRVGKMSSGEVVVVSYTWREGVRRIITAHRSRTWRDVYEKEISK